MAKIILETNNIFSIGPNASDSTVYGAAGTEKVILAAGSYASIDQNVERTELSGASSSYTYAIAGNKIIVSSGSKLVATIIGGNGNKTIAFSDGSAVLALTGLNKATLGGQAISTTASALAGVTLNTMDKSASSPVLVVPVTSIYQDLLNNTASTTYVLITNSDGSYSEISTSAEEGQNSQTISIFDSLSNLISYETKQYTGNLNTTSAIITYHETYSETSTENGLYIESSKINNIEGNHSQESTIEEYDLNGNRTRDKASYVYIDGTSDIYENLYVYDAITKILSIHEISTHYDENGHYVDESIITYNYDPQHIYTFEDELLGVELSRIETVSQYNGNGSLTSVNSPILKFAFPGKGATAVSVNQDIILGFNEAIQIGTGNITLVSGSDSRTISIADPQVKISGTTLTINPTVDFNIGSTYKLHLDAGAIKDLAPVSNTRSAIDLSFATQTTGDNQAPVLQNYAGKAVVSDNIQLTFQENIKIGKGTFTLSDGTASIFIPVTDTSQVSIVNNVLIINPVQNLNPEKLYMLTAPKGIVTDLSNNEFAGISATAPFTFDTHDKIPPTLTITDDKTATTNATILYTFTASEAIMDFTVDDITVTGGIKGEFKAVTGTNNFTLSVTPTANSTTPVTVNVAAGKFTDLVGNNNLKTINDAALLTSYTIGTLTSAQIGAINTVTLQSITPEAIVGLTSENILGLSPSQIVALTQDQVASLTSVQAKALTASQIAALESADILALPPATLAAITPSAFASLNSEAFASMSPEQISKITTGQIATMSVDQLSKIGADQALAITSAQINVLSSAQLDKLSAEATGALTIQAIAGLNKTNMPGLSLSELSGEGQIAALKPAQYGFLSTGQINLLDAYGAELLTPSNISALTSAQVGAINTLTLQSITQTAITGFTSKNILGLGTAQIVALTEEQAAVLAPVQAKVLTSTQIEKLEPVDILALHPATIAALTTAAFAKLNAAAFASMSPEQISKITTGQIATMSVEQLSNIGADQAVGFNSAQLTKLTATQATALSTTAINNLTPGSIVNLNITSFDATDIKAISDDAFSCLTAATSQIGGLNATQVGAFEASQIAAMRPATFAGLVPTTATSVTTATVLNALSATAVPEINTAQINALGAVKMEYLNQTNAAKLQSDVTDFLYLIGHTLLTGGGATVSGIETSNTVLAGTGTTKIVAGKSSVNITGSATSVAILGSTNADTITGGAGNDTITGGDGIDSMTGGTGDDTFVFSGDLDTKSVDYTDLITDFKSGSDKISGFGVDGSTDNVVFADKPIDSLTSLLKNADDKLDGVFKFYVGQVTGTSDAYLVTDNNGIGYTHVIKLTGVTLTSFLSSDIINWTIDKVAPKILITDNQPSVATGGAILYTFTLSEPSNNFSIDDITVTGGTKAATLTTLSSTSYTLSVTPNNNSITPITVDVAAGKFTDAAGNLNIAAVQSIQEVKTTPTLGKAIDGYLAGATVTVGTYTTITDAMGNFTLPAGLKGEVVVSGGTDLTTGKAFKGVLKAPEGASTVTPLTTVQQGFIASGQTPAEAQASVAKAFGFANNVDLTQYDPIDALKNASPADKAQATALMANAAKIANFLVTAGETLKGSGGDKVTAASAGDAILKSLVNSVSSAGSTGVIDLGNASLLTTVLNDSAKEVAKTVTGTTDNFAAKITVMAVTVASVIKDATDNITAVVAAGGSSDALLANMGNVSKFTQEGASAQLQTIAKTLDPANAIAILASALSTLTGYAADKSISKGSTTPDPVMSTSTGGGSTPITPVTGSTTSVSAAGSTDTSQSNVAFNFAAGTYQYTISGFSSGDSLNFPSNSTPTIINSDFNDGTVDVKWAYTGNAVSIHLTGLTSAQDDGAFNVPGFNNVFGAGSLV